MQPVQVVQPTQDPNAEVVPIIATQPNELVVPSPDPIPSTASSLLSAATLVEPKDPAPSAASLAPPIINIYVNTDPSKMSTSRINIMEAKPSLNGSSNQENKTAGSSFDAITKVEKYNY
jgi:hypothetical protein